MTTDKQNTYVNLLGEPIVVGDRYNSPVTLFPAAVNYEPAKLEVSTSSHEVAVSADTDTVVVSGVFGLNVDIPSEKPDGPLYIVPWAVAAYMSRLGRQDCEVPYQILPEEVGITRYARLVRA